MGRRLFITYVNDLSDSIRSGEAYMCADNTTIYITGKTADEVTITLQVILNQLQTWCQKNRSTRHFAACTQAVVILGGTSYIAVWLIILHLKSYETLRNRCGRAILLLIEFLGID